MMCRSNPQTLNRYAYVRNNLLNWIDPFGLDVDEDTCGDDWYASSHAECPGGGGWFPPIWIPIGGDSGTVSGGPGTITTGNGGKPGGLANFPNGEQLGFPTGFPFPQPDIWALLIPGSVTCEWGPCVPIGNSFAGPDFGTASGCVSPLIFVGWCINIVHGDHRPLVHKHRLQLRGLTVCLGQRAIRVEQNNPESRRG
jgi:hypothetical protein